MNKRDELLLESDVIMKECECEEEAAEMVGYLKMSPYFSQGLDNEADQEM